MSRVAARCDHTGIVYTDPATNRAKLLVFGGRSIDPNPGVYDSAYGDLWSLDLEDGEWSLLYDGTDKSGPGPRFAHAAALTDHGRKLVSPTTARQRGKACDRAGLL